MSRNIISDLIVRSARLQDTEVITQLFEQWGYPHSPEFVRQKIHQLTGAFDAVLVAESHGEILGFISIHLVPQMHALGLLGKVTSLIVNQQHRGQGIGRELIRAAESFALRNGARRIEIISGNHRSGAPDFYQAVGYAPTDQTRFVREAVAV